MEQNEETLWKGILMHLLSLFYISIFSNFITLMIFLVFAILTAPVSVPFLLAKLKKGNIIIMKMLSGGIRFIYADQEMHTKNYGTFLPNPKAATRLAGVSAYVAYEGHATPPTIEASKAAEKLKENHVLPEEEIKDTAERAFNSGILEEYDVSAIYEYAAAINPHYVDARIERRAAELARGLRNPLPQIFGYAIVLIIVLIGFALFWKIIAGGAGGAAVSGLANAISPSTVNM